MSSRKRGPRPVEMGLAAVVAIVLAVNPDAPADEIAAPLPRQLG